LHRFSLREAYSLCRLSEIQYVFYCRIAENGVRETPQLRAFQASTRTVMAILHAIKAEFH
jgi:hypothetical protein